MIGLLDFVTDFSNKTKMDFKVEYEKLKPSYKGWFWNSAGGSVLVNASFSDGKEWDTIFFNIAYDLTTGKKYLRASGSFDERRRFSGVCLFDLEGKQ